MHRVTPPLPKNALIFKLRRASLRQPIAFCAQKALFSASTALVRSSHPLETLHTHFSQSFLFHVKLFPIIDSLRKASETTVAALSDMFYVKLPGTQIAWKDVRNGGCCSIRYVSRETSQNTDGLERRRKRRRLFYSICFT